MSDDEYRFHPEDFEGEGDPVPAGPDPAPLLIVASLGVGVGLFFASLVVPSPSVAGVAVDLEVLAAAVFALGLAAGGASYFRRGRPRIGAVHVAGATGWALLAVGTVLSSRPARIAGVVALVAGTVALVGLAWRSGT